MRLLFCLCVFGGVTFLYVDNQIGLMRVRLQIPLISKELRTIQEQNSSLQYEIDRFENPSHLIEISRKPEFGHLHHPLIAEIWEIDLDGKS